MIACPAARRSRSSLPGRLQKPTAQPLAARRAAYAPHGSRRNRNDGTQRRSRAAVLRAPAALTRPQRAAGAGVRSEDGSQILAFQYEQHVHSSLRSVLNHPGPVSESHHRL